MTTIDKAGNGIPASGGAFATTQWSVVLAAKQSDGAQSEAAMERLCRTYWPPLRAYIRREDYTADDAKDLAQEFLSRLVHKEWLNPLHDRRAKLRSFLFTFLKHLRLRREIAQTVPHPSEVNEELRHLIQLFAR